MELLTPLDGTGPTKMADTFIQGDLCFLTRDIVDSNMLAFKQNDPVIIIKIEPSPKNPKIRCVVYSVRTQKQYKLKDDVLAKFEFLLSGSKKTDEPAREGKVGDPVQTGELAIKVINTIFLKNLTDWEPENIGYIVFRAEVEASNNGAKAIQIYGDNDWHLITSEGYHYDFRSDGFIKEVAPAFPRTTLDPGQRARGYLFTEVPPNINLVEIVFDNWDSGRARIKL